MSKTKYRSKLIHSWLKIFMLGCLCLLLFSQNLYALPEDSKNIILLPFEINTEKELSYLEKKLPVMLREKLINQDLSVLPQNRTEFLLQEHGISVLNLKRAKDMAMLSGADYALYGSFNQVGQMLSIDARLVADLTGQEAEAIYVQQRGKDKVDQAIDKLIQKIKKAIGTGKEITEIRVEGNKILGKDFILMRLDIQKGDQLDPKRIDDQVKKLYETGYFNDVKVNVRNYKGGKEVVFQVKEKPRIQRIVVQGSEEMDEDDVKEVMSTAAGSVLNLKVLRQDLDKIREMYRKKGYYTTKVTYRQEEIGPGRATLVIDIEEGEKIFIEKIEIKGAEKLDPGDLKDQLALSERGLFSWITGGGILKEELLDRDAAALEAYYANRGFLDVQVAQPKVNFEEEGIHIVFHVDEGPRYKVRQVNLKGDLVVNPEELYQVIKMDDLGEKDEYFARAIVRQDTQDLTDFYANYGYAFADVNVSIDKDKEDKVVNIEYNLNKEQKVYIRRIRIAGNTKTRDNVIRRELKIAEGDKFSGKKLAQSKQHLSKLDYFESVEIESEQTREENKMDLKVEVKEKSTGAFSLGAGYSNVDNFFVTGQVQQRNLFGKGYRFHIEGSMGGTINRYRMGFWNPQLYDGPLGMGIDAYNTEWDYDKYDLDTTGGKLKFAYTIGDYTRLFWNYSLEQYTLEDIEHDASQEIQDLEGDNWSSALYLAATRDTTNKRFNPTKGSENTASVEYSGGVLGGDDNFIKLGYDFSWFKHVFWDVTFNWHWKVGYLIENEDEDVPDFERFYLGGIDSVRGYDYRDIACEDDFGDEVGGYKEFYTNYELVFPIEQNMGLLGVVFFDAGNVWNEDDSMDLDFYKSVGLGVRWNSPMGPLRIEYGYPLDDLEDEDTSGKFEFSVGQFF